MVLSGVAPLTSRAAKVRHAIYLHAGWAVPEPDLSPPYSEAIRDTAIGPPGLPCTPASGSGVDDGDLRVIVADKGSDCDDCLQNTGLIVAKIGNPVVQTLAVSLSTE